MTRGILNRFGILQRTLITVMAPLLAVVLALGYHFTNANMEDARDALNERGTFMAKHLAMLSEFGIYSQDILELQKNVELVLKEPDVAAVAILNKQNDLLVNVANETGPPGDKGLVTFTAPVTRSGVGVDDYADEIDSVPQAAADSTIGSVSVTLSDAGVRNKQQEILHAGTLITLTGLLLSFLLAWYVAKSVTGPITQLTATVGRLTGGKLESRIRVSSPGELGELERGINQMAASLQGAHGELTTEVENATAALQDTVAKLELRNSELDHARDEAQRAGFAKSDFLARMSHEIRTPLSAVIGFSRLLENTPQSETQQEYTRTIVQAASQLLLIIDDILDFSRLDSEHMEMEHRSFDLYENLENIVSIQSTTAHEKHLELVLLIHSDVPRNITSDAKRFNQVLTNLVSNAIKFTDTGHVVVNVAVSETHDTGITLEIDVVDTGIGLSKLQAANIFKPFTQADVSTSRQYGGTGLGLSITRRLVEIMNGTIHVLSTPGRGSTFTVTLPVSCNTGQARHPHPLSGLKVLVFDANPFALRAIRNRFFTWGASVFNTGDPDKLLEMVAGETQQPYDLVVTGLPVESVDRESINAMIRAVRNLSDVPLLLMVSCQAHDLLFNINEDDCTGIIPKPPRSDRLLRTVRQLTGTATMPGRVPDTDMHDSNSRPAADTGLRILVVEDNLYIQSLMQHILKTMGISVAMAPNGMAACELAETTRFDLVFMDLHMPGMGGLEAARRIRQGINSATPIIALTADVFACGRRDPSSACIDDCLHKPFSEADLSKILQKWSGRQAGDNPATGKTSPLTDSGKEDIRETLDKIPPDFHERLVSALRTEIDAIRSAVQKRLPEDTRKHMHQLKGIVEYFRLDEFSDCFNALQQAVSAGEDEATLASLLDELESVIRKTARAAADPPSGQTADS
ncbi:MAG: ATP-binding protein [Gammaproteobacteria bacterium]|nr:ATP-binding protein [Gammaproteobacteria bacterium]